MTMTSNTLAFDRASVRTIDRDGRLHVAMTNISKANVCPYRGDEIPGYEALGLDATRIYQLLRDPDELEKSAPTFNNLPVLSRHVAVSADNHKPEDVVGSTGTDAEFVAPYLRNSMVIWAADAIKGIESGEQREISCAYRYDPVMELGEFNGVHYDGRMTNISGNHVALVPLGRAGRDVVVGDSALPNEDTKMALKDAVKGAMPALVKLATDGDIDGLVELIGELNPKEKGEMPEEKKPGEEPAKDAPEGEIPPKDKDDVVLAKVRSALEELVKLLKSPAATTEAEQPVGDDPPDTAGTPGKPDRKDEEAMVSKPAMDAALAAHGARVEQATISRLRAIAAAENDVRPIVGQLAGAFDSAEQVYGAALKTMNVDITDITGIAALKALTHAHGARKADTKARVAMDSASANDFNKAFPGASRIRVM